MSLYFTRFSKTLKILDLRRQVEPRRIWLQAVGPDYWNELHERRKTGWSLLRLAKKDDLLLFWHKTPRSQLRHIAMVSENAMPDVEWEWGGNIRVIARLGQPVTLKHIQASGMLRGASFVRGNFQERYDVTPWWAELYRLITVVNPDLRKELAKYFAL